VKRTDRLRQRLHALRSTSPTGDGSAVIRKLEALARGETLPERPREEIARDEEAWRRTSPAARELVTSTLRRLAGGHDA
jgi:hypothetical protein